MRPRRSGRAVQSARVPAPAGAAFIRVRHEFRRALPLFPTTQSLCRSSEPTPRFTYQCRHLP
jgi:hypothetical protein